MTVTETVSISSTSEEVLGCNHLSRGCVQIQVSISSTSEEVLGATP